MKIRVRHVDNRGRKIRRKAPVYDAVLIPVRKGVWYLDVSFKVRTEVFSYAWDSEEPLVTGIWFETGDKVFTIIEIDTSEEGMKFDIFASMSKTSYRGIVIEEKMVHRAIDKYNGE